MPTKRTNTPAKNGYEEKPPASASVSVLTTPCRQFFHRHNKTNLTSPKHGKWLFYLILIFFFTVVPAVAQEAVDYCAPWVTKTTTTSAIINWRGSTSGSGSVEYATVRYYNEHHVFEKTVESETTGTYQHVRIIGLKPNTSYVYRVKPSDNEDVFSDRFFRTMPVSGPFTFIVLSDTQEGHNYTEAMRFKYVADAIAKEEDVLFILHGGDYAGHDSEGLWAKYFQAADTMLAKFALFTTIGNHEYHNSAGPNAGPTPADQYHWSYDTPLNYSFDCAGIRFIILNSPDPNNANLDDPQTSLALAQSQAHWLRKLLDNNMRGTFTIHHHPIWDFGRTDINPDLEPWENLYHAYHISATFAGHTHNYQRYSVKGIPYFVVGNAGGRFADINATDPRAIWYVTGETRELGYLKVTVDPARNRATAQEIFVASVKDDDSAETPHVYDPPIVADTVSFRLKSKSCGKGAPAGKSKIGHLYLHEKDPADWSIVEGGAWGKMTYNLSGSNFEFDFNGHHLEAYTAYLLIYYPDPWPGSGLEILGHGMTDVYGDVHIKNSLNTGDLPIGADKNDGAKIWLVLADDLDNNFFQMEGWHPSRYLFEDNLITFDDTGDHCLLPGSHPIKKVVHPDLETNFRKSARAHR